MQAHLNFQKGATFFNRIMAAKPKDKLHESDKATVAKIYAKQQVTFGKVQNTYQRLIAEFEGCEYSAEILSPYCEISKDIVKALWRQVRNHYKESYNFDLPYISFSDIRDIKDVNFPKYEDVLDFLRLNIKAKDAEASGKQQIIQKFNKHATKVKIGKSYIDFPDYFFFNTYSWEAKTDERTLNYEGITALKEIIQLFLTDKTIVESWLAERLPKNKAYIKDSYTIGENKLINKVRFYGNGKVRFSFKNPNANIPKFVQMVGLVEA